jgi:GDPmannose 4,6-dehydratase
VELAFARVGRRIVWRGLGVDERGFDAKTNRPLVKIDPRYFRPTEVELLIGDPAKARAKLGWQHAISFPELVAEMVDADMALVAREHAGGRRLSLAAVG